MTWPDTTTWVVIVVAGLGTYLFRLSFLAVADRVADLPDHVRDALRMVPAATLAALVAPALLRPEGPWLLLGPRAVAGLVAALVAWWSKSVLATIVVGLFAVIALQPLLG